MRRTVFGNWLLAISGWLLAIIVASDARCIEWAYGKVMLVKRLLTEFLDTQIADGWSDVETAVRASRDWLYDCAAAGYTTE